MPLRTPAAMTFIAYEVRDTGVELTFRCDDPGPGEQSFWSIFLTDAEIAGAGTLSQFRNLVVSKLQRKYRASGLSTFLDARLGQSVSI